MMHVSCSSEVHRMLRVLGIHVFFLISCFFEHRFSFCVDLNQFLSFFYDIIAFYYLYYWLLIVT